MPEALTGIPARVEALERQLSEASQDHDEQEIRRKQEREAMLDRLAAQDLKLAGVGKLSLAELVKFATVAMAAAGLISGGIQLLVSKGQAEQQGRLVAAEDRLAAVDQKQNAREVWMRDVTGRLQGIESDLRGAMAQVQATAAMTGDRFRRSDHETYAAMVERERDQLRADLTEQERRLEKLVDEFTKWKGGDR